jgi:hypothetical protein
VPDSVRFTPLYGPPTDPSYLRFSEGLDRWFEGDLFTHKWVRWHPRNATWYDYSPPGYQLIDLQWHTTDFGFRFGNDFPDFMRPAAFQAVAAFYEAVKLAQPHAVWNPRDGAWRVAEVTGGGKPPPVIPPGPGTDLERARNRGRADRERELAYAYREYADGRLDTEAYKRELDRIEAKYKELV